LGVKSQKVVAAAIVTMDLEVAIETGGGVEDEEIVTDANVEGRFLL
jgi:hypothetical protein